LNGPGGGLGNCTRIGSPLVVDLGGRGIALSDAAHGASFDLYASGETDRLSWFEEPDATPLLVLDRNENGAIDDGRELFGSSTPGPGPHGATFGNGFDALAAFDADGSGFIDAGDAVYASLRLWTDRDRDGKSTPDELAPLAAFGVRAIGLDYALALGQDRFGNMFRERATVFMSNGETRPIVDVYFAERP
jgi:hypothetical protein